VVIPNRSRVRPKRSLGQNFLRDDNIARKIAASVHPRGDDVMLEIGPGEGALTRFLAPRVRTLIAVDVDNRVIKHLQAVFTGAKVTFLHQDFLRTDLADLARGGQLRIVGNIPYNITSPILFHLLDHREYIRDITLMVQKEFARRLSASPGTKDYGILSVFCQLFADVKLLFDVSPNAFVPKPTITSSVVHLDILDAPRHPLTDEWFFRRMIRSVFGKRRKTLRNSLSYFMKEFDDVVPPHADLQKRPEELSIQQLVQLSNDLFRYVRSLPT
jgi:16S rRNA (adenine1518-N6/adenine1519-N6)-dimethyltransferase